MIDDLVLARTLLEQGIANREQLREARQLQLTQETTLYLAMVEHDIIEESLLVEVAAGLLNVPFVTLLERDVPSEIAGLVPVDMARTHGVLPLELREDAQGELLLLAMRDPLDINAMDSVSTHVNVGIQPILCGPKDLFQAIERAQHQKLSLSMPRDNSVDFGEFSTSAQHEEESLAGEDSWGVFFDDALSQPEPGDAQAMRNRPTSTMALDLMDIDEILDAEGVSRDDALNVLDSPGEPSSVEMDALNGWEVDSSIGSVKHSSPPPPPFPRHKELASSFDVLHASIDLDEEPAPSGTFIAGPSTSLTNEHSAPELYQEEALPFQSFEGFTDGEFIGEAPSLSVLDDANAQEISEPAISDEAGSQTHMGSLGQIIGTEHHLRDVSLTTHDRVPISLNNPGSFTTLGTPKRLNADGTERPMLVITSDGEDLFGQALADIDASDGIEPVPEDATSEDATSEGFPEEDADDELAMLEPPEPKAALGRLKLKRVVMPRQGLLDSPVVERSRVVEKENVVIQGTSQTHERYLGVNAAEEVQDEGAGAIRDILDDDDILAGFQAALDEEDERDAHHHITVAHELADETQEGIAEDRVSSQRGGMDATREFDASSLFTFTGDGEDGLDEATSAALGEAHARIERLNSMIRNANRHARAEQDTELGDQGTDGEADATPSGGLRAARRDESRARAGLSKTGQSTLDLSSDLLLSGTGSLGLPPELDDSRLLRAALLILISQDLIKVDELIALARSLPPNR